MNQISGYGIYYLITPGEFFNDKIKPNYDLIKHMDENHFEELFNYWRNPSNNFSYYKLEINRLKLNYKKYLNEITIKDIIE